MKGDSGLKNRSLYHVSPCTECSLSKKKKI